MEKTIRHPLLGEVRYIKRLKCRTLRVSIHPARGIRVRVPFFVSYARAQAFVEEKAEQIARMMQRQRQRKAVSERQLGRGTEISTLGRSIRFEYSPAGRPDGPKIFRGAGRYEIRYPAGWGERPAAGTPQGEALKECYLQALRKEAREQLLPRVERWAGFLNAMTLRPPAGPPAASAGENPFRYNRVAFKNNRTNWGSCSARGNLNLNIHLAELPEELADFVIIHELCHLVHPNHGPQFHALVNAACGGREKELQKKLKGYRLD